MPIIFPSVRFSITQPPHWQIIRSNGRRNCDTVPWLSIANRRQRADADHDLQHPLCEFGDGEDVWANRADTVARTIQQADIIGLQEVVLNQLQDLQQNAPGYTWFGVGRDDGKEKGEFCPIAFDTDRFKLVRSGTFWLSPEPDQVGKAGWDAALPRIATWVVLQTTTMIASSSC